MTVVLKGKRTCVVTFSLLSLWSFFRRPNQEVLTNAFTQSNPVYPTSHSSLYGSLFHVLLSLGLISGQWFETHEARQRGCYSVQAQRWRRRPPTYKETTGEELSTFAVSQMVGERPHARQMVVGQPRVPYGKERVVYGRRDIWV